MFLKCNTARKKLCSETSLVPMQSLTPSIFITCNVKSLASFPGQPTPECDYGGRACACIVSHVSKVQMVRIERQLFHILYAIHPTIYSAQRSVVGYLPQLDMWSKSHTAFTVSAAVNLRVCPHTIKLSLPSFYSSASPSLQHFNAYVPAQWEWGQWGC